jgi:hypothetical protein
MDSCLISTILDFRDLTYLVAFRTNERALQLALEEIHDDTVVPLLVPAPALFAQLSQLPVASSRFPIWLFDVWLLDDSV